MPPAPCQPLHQPSAGPHRSRIQVRPGDEPAAAIRTGEDLSALRGKCAHGAFGRTRRNSPGPDRLFRVRAQFRIEVAGADEAGEGAGAFVHRAPMGDRQCDLGHGAGRIFGLDLAAQRAGRACEAVLTSTP